MTKTMFFKVEVGKNSMADSTYKSKWPQNRLLPQ